MFSHPKGCLLGRGDHPKEMDIVDFGEFYAYGAMDIYTREAQVVLLPGLTSQDEHRALESVMAYFGSCKVLQAEGGKGCLDWCKYELSEREELQKEAQGYLEYYHYGQPHLGLGVRIPLPPIHRV